MRIAAVFTIQVISMTRTMPIRQKATKRERRDGRRCRLSASLLSLVLLITLAGCAAPSGPEVKAVERYLEGLPTALHADTLDPIRDVASDDQIDKVRRYVSMILNYGQRMEAELLDLQVLSSTVDGDTAIVEMKEQWHIVYVDAEEGTLVSEENYLASVRYVLLDLDGAWIVIDIEETERAQQ